MESFGILSLLPPLIAITLAFLTRNVLLSLFFGVFLGSTMAAGWNPIIGFLDSLGEYIIPVMGSNWNASVILMTLFVGSFSILLERGGGATSFGLKMRKYIHTRKQAQIATWLGGIIVFFSDSSNSVLVGPIFRPITDRLKVSREKLAYICDSTASSVPLLLPITAWGAFIMGILKNHLPEGTNVFITFVKAIPFNLYTITCIVLVLYIAVTDFDFGPMRKAELRAITEGKVLADDANPRKKDVKVEIPKDANPTVWNMITPLLALIGTLFAVFLYTVGFPEESFIKWCYDVRIVFCFFCWLNSSNNISS